jgi:serine phosphatase RsbU (regulator of sigma subunit)
MVIVLFILVYRNLQNNKRKNKIIEIQKNEVEQKNELLEHKQKEILDSINYAQRIQSSILPPLDEIYLALPNSFVLFKPKDIVSGDFYWFAKKGSKNFTAAADCTGHGVPGAFMSMLNSDKLNEAIALHDDVSEILKSVNKGLKKALGQSDRDDSTRDGMDIALISLNKEMTQLEYAAANRPLWIIHYETNEISEIKATKTAIGGYTEDEQVFTKHEVQLNKGDTIYIFSDGYADQFSSDDKKLMTRQFKENLLKIQSMDMGSQRDYLDNFIEAWKSGIEQTDDILVIGVKI